MGSVAESRPQHAQTQADGGKLARVARVDELRGDGPHAVSADGVDLVLVRAAGGLKAYQGLCPHQGALLGEGELDGDTLVCRNHRWRYSVDTGKRQGGPQCLAACPVVVKDGDVLADVGAMLVESRVSKGARKPDDLPGPRGLPIVGNLLQLDLPRLHEQIEKWAAQYGTVFMFRMGPKRAITVSEPELIGQVLRNRPETYRRLSNIEAVFEEMGAGGVFSVEGAKWRPQRRLAMEALSHRHLRGFYPTLRIVAERLRKRWLRAAEREETLDMVEELKRFTVDVTTTLTFGHDVNTIEADDDVIQRKLELFFPALNKRLFALVPLWRYIRMPSDRRLDRALGELRTWLGGLVVQARKRLEADPAARENPSNFLEAMLVARDETGQPFSNDVIFGNLVTMLLAGEDTTAYTLGWAIHQLCDSAASVTSLRKEVDSLLGASLVPEDIGVADKLVYTGAVANETMRLRPVAPFMIFEANVGTVLGDVDVPAGTQVVVCMRPPAVSAEHFADPTVFRPERWVDGGTSPHDPSAHTPFGSGPRICPGRSLALLEMKVVLSMIYKTFDVVRAPGSGPVREHFAFTMSPAGLNVRLHVRQ